jgi:pilus assembly protein CpaD
MSSTDLRALALLAATAVLLAGCATPRASDGTAMVTPTEQFIPKVSETPETLALAPHVTGLSDNQRSALAVFAAKVREAGGAEITLRTPSGGRDAVTPARMTAQVVTALEDLGVSRSHVRLVGYDGSQDPASPVVLSYQSYVAEIPDCSTTWNNVGATRDNQPTKNFGCANTANFAAMIADPRDILRPAETEPGDNTRRQVVMGKYRQGQITATARDEQAAGVISRTVQ